MLAFNLGAFTPLRRFLTLHLQALAWLGQVRSSKVDIYGHLCWFKMDPNVVHSSKSSQCIGHSNWIEAEASLAREETSVSS